MMQSEIKGATAAHMKVIRVDGTVEYRTSFSWPVPFWNLKAWYWLWERRKEYKKLEAL